MGIVTLDFQNLDLSCSEELCRLLENGEILYFPKSPLQIPDKDIDFLLAQRQVKSGYRMNDLNHSESPLSPKSLLLVLSSGKTSSFRNILSTGGNSFRRIFTKQHFDELLRLVMKFRRINNFLERF